jgi:hypothetical protein
MERAQIQSSNNGQRTSYLITAADKEAVVEAIEGIYRAYHPLGYGTSFGKVQMLEESGQWICHGHRYNSCD